MEEGASKVPQDDGAEDARGLRRRLLALRRGELPPPKTVLLIGLVVAIVVVSVIAAALVMRSPDEREGPDGGGGLVITELEPFNRTVDSDAYLEEGGDPYDMTLDFYYAIVHPEEYGEIVICFIEGISVTVRWQDEPDETRYIVQWENQPDTVHVDLYDMNGSFEVADEASNDHGEEAIVQVSWWGDGTFYEESWRREDEHGWHGVSGQNFVEVEGGEVLWGEHFEASCFVVEAGDQTHDRLPFGFADDGNEVHIEVTLSGYYLSLPPGSY